MLNCDKEMTLVQAAGVGRLLVVWLFRPLVVGFATIGALVLIVLVAASEPLSIVGASSARFLVSLGAIAAGTTMVLTGHQALPSWMLRKRPPSPG